MSRSVALRWQLPNALVLLLLLAPGCGGTIAASGDPGPFDAGTTGDGDHKGDTPEPADPCATAEANRSYVGCSYWPTVTTNSEVSDDFTFAVVVANAGTEPAAVRVTSAAGELAHATVAPDGVATIELPWVPRLKWGLSESMLVPEGAYHLTSSVPVSVYQFNPLDYQIPGTCYDGWGTGGNCYSYSNDASLLLPEHTLAEEYMVISMPANVLCVGPQCAGTPGFFSVVGVKPGNTTVTVTFAADTLAGPQDNLLSYSAGQTAEFTLPQHGVLQIASAVPSSCTPTSSDATGNYCDTSATTDLTGSLIRSDQPVAVYGGHDCTFVPFDKWACDHLEEQLFPLQAWGQRYVATHTASSGDDPSIYRVVSAADGNRITFNPPVHSEVVLDRGQHMQLVTTQDFEVEGTGRLALVQLMVGQNYSNPTPMDGAPGDPSMMLAVPVEQYRTRYRFLAPQSYQQNYVNVIATADAVITLDGQPIAGEKLVPIGKTSLRVARLAIAGGAHAIESSSPFGITVYGVGSYTSYMFPGGLDLRKLIL